MYGAQAPRMLGRPADFGGIESLPAQARRPGMPSNWQVMSLSTSMGAWSPLLNAMGDWQDPMPETAVARAYTSSIVPPNTNYVQEPKRIFGCAQPHPTDFKILTAAEALPKAEQLSTAGVLAYMKDTTGRTTREYIIQAHEHTRNQNNASKLAALRMCSTLSTYPAKRLGP